MKKEVVSQNAYIFNADELDSWSLMPTEQASKAINLSEYMLTQGRFNADANVTLVEMSERFTNAGVPLDRCATIVRILHSINSASMRVWEPEKGAEYSAIPYKSNPDGQYTSSPSALAHSTRSWVRFNPQLTPENAFGIVPELKQGGFTDYLCVPTFMVNQMQNVFTFATRAANGFSIQNIAFIKAAFPAIEACQEILVTHRILKEVTRIYVGEEPHRRILAGDVRRGEVTRINSSILFADMRGFTRMTADLSAEASTALLNDYYDCVVPAIEQNGGEVLKFIGDGILAIFRAGNKEQEACQKALAAGKVALENVAARNAQNSQKFDIGVALHFGEVAYGNVGSGERLDYTVIGADVNLASRIADLCGKLDQSMLISSDFQEFVAGQEVLPMGDHELKGIKKPTPVFAVV